MHDFVTIRDESEGQRLAAWPSRCRFTFASVGRGGGRSTEISDSSAIEQPSAMSSITRSARTLISPTLQAGPSRLATRTALAAPRLLYTSRRCLSTARPSLAEVRPGPAISQTNRTCPHLTGRLLSSLTDSYRCRDHPETILEDRPYQTRRIRYDIPTPCKVWRYWY